MLHQVFDYSHAEIAQILTINEAASRQVLHRAKEHVAAGKPRFESNRDTHERRLHAFANAVSRGDVQSIANVLAADATLYGDGGGKVRGAILRPVLGRDRIARFFAGLGSKLTAGELAVDVKDVNGWPALIGATNAGVSFVITIETESGLISTIRNIVNPEKLALRRTD